MVQRATWKLVEESSFRGAVVEARRAGVDTEGWALYTGMMPGRTFVRLNPNRSVATVHRGFSSPGEADLFFQGMRWALSRVERKG